MKKAKYVYTKSRRGVRFKLVARNGEDLTVPSQVYRDMTDAKRGALDLAMNAMEAALPMIKADGT